MTESVREHDRRIGNVDLNLLPLLLALLRERSVTRAASRVGLSQPAMSNALKRLRRLFDDPLLVGAGGSYRLTPRARSLLEPLEHTLRLVESDVLQVAEFDPAHSNRVFRVASSSTTAFAVLRPVIAEASRRWPSLAFAVVGLRREADRMFGDVDLDLVLLPTVLPSEHPRERLYDEDWVIVVDREHPEVGATLHVEQLRELPHAVYEEFGLRTPAELAISVGGGAVRSTVVVEDHLSVLHLVRGSRMIGIVQRAIARELAEGNGLRVLESPVRLPSFGVDMVWSPLRSQDPACDWLARQLREVAPTPVG